MKQILMVAEKPSIAEALANALCSKKEKIQKSKRTSPVSPVLEFEGYFPFIKRGEEKVWIKITSCTGHVYKREFTKEFLDWDKNPPITLFDAQTEKLEANPKGRMPAHFRKEAKDCSYLVLWLDCDREGENICFEVMKTACCAPGDTESRLIPKNKVLRAVFSALDEKSLSDAYWGLSGDGPNKCESDAVEARQELDLKIGVAWTRYQTKFYRGRYRDLDASVVSYGPCQTPTLWFCVQRHDEKEAFQPEKFWTLNLKLRVETLFERLIAKQKLSDPSGTQPLSQQLKKKYAQCKQFVEQAAKGTGRDECIDLEWTKGPLFNYEAASGFKQMLTNCGDTAGGSSSSTSSSAAKILSSPQTFSLEVTGCASKEMQTARPQGMNTVTMLKLASQLLQMGPLEAMREAEHLYLRGYLTYPRTETTTYPKGLDLDGLLKAQCQNGMWGEQARDLKERGRKPPRKGTDAGDHPPITPTLQIPQSVDEIGRTAWRLYELICRNFLASISADLRFEQRKWQLTLSNSPANNSSASNPHTKDAAARYQFTLSERKLIDPGFMRVQQANFNEESFEISFNNSTPYDIGAHLKLHDVVNLKYDVQKDDDLFFNRSNKKKIASDMILELKEGVTSAPDYLSEADLLALMDANGIGTDASMATHINTICVREYVEITGGRRLVPTKLGIALVHGYSLVDNELCVPKMRQDMETSCTMVAKGEATRKQVIEHTLTTFKKKFEFFQTHIDYMDQLFQKEYDLAGSAGGLLGGSSASVGGGNLVKGKGGKVDNGPSLDELRELQRLGLGKGDYEGKLKGGKGGKGGKKGRGKGDRGKGDDDDRGGGKKGRKRDRDDDYVAPDEQCYVVQSGGYNAMASAGQAGPAGGGGLVIVNAKEKKTKEIEKKLKEIERLEQRVAVEGLVLDVAQKKKVGAKTELEEELRRVLGKY